MVDIVILFIIFCAAWIVTQIIWKTIESYMQRKQIEKTMDMIYSRFVRLGLALIQDLREVKKNA